MQRRARLGSTALCLVVAFAGPVGLSSAPADAAQKNAAQKKATATFKNGVLTVRGTDKGQRMSVVRSKGKVTIRVGGKKVVIPKGYRNSRCDRIRLLGRGGDDRITVDDSGGRLPRVVLDGGVGADTLTGGSGDDLLTGGRGRDVLRPGAAGTDDLDGGLGADTYLIDAGHPGYATIIERFGEEGPRDHLSFAPTATQFVSVSVNTDAIQHVGPYAVEMDYGGIEDLTGGGGDDRLSGGHEANRIAGGPGNDVLYGGDTGLGDVLSGGAGDDRYNIYGDSVSFPGSARLEDSSGTDTVSFAATTSSTVQASLGTTAWQAVTPHFQLQLASATAFENLTGGGSLDLLTGNDLDNHLVGGGGQDTYAVGEASGGAETFGDDTVSDFAAGVDAVDLDAGLSVRSGLGTATVTIWDGGTDVGTISAANGHLWGAGDFV